MDGNKKTNGCEVAQCNDNIKTLAGIKKSF